MHKLSSCVRQGPETARASLSRRGPLTLKVRQQIRGEIQMKALRTLFTMVLLLGAATVYSQAANVAFLRVSIPFNFTVDNQQLPAGDYTVSESELNPQSVILLQSADGQHVAVVHTHQTFMLSPAANAELVFQHSGGEYFLSQVWTAGQTSGRELVLRERAKELSKNNSSGDDTTAIAGASF